MIHRLVWIITLIGLTASLADAAPAGVCGDGIQSQSAQASPSVSNARRPQYLFQPPHAPGRVSFDDHFYFFHPFGDLIVPIASTMRGWDPSFIARAGRKEWLERHRRLLFSINFGIMRGGIPDPHEEIPEGLEIFALLKEYLFQPIARSLGPFYDSLRNQGPERALLLPDVLDQDASEIDRVTHIAISRFVKPLAHCQILISRGPHEPLHIDREWPGETAEIVDHAPGHVSGELGRLIVIHPNDYQFDDHRQLVPLMDTESSRLKTNQIIIHLLLQRTLAWVNSDAKLDQLLIQVNHEVERLLKIYKIPLWLGKRFTRKKLWLDGKEIEEVIYAFDKKELLEAEDILMRYVLIHWLESTQTQEIFQYAPGDTLFLSFFSNEYNVLRRTHLVDFLYPGASLPVEFEDGMLEVGLPFKKIPALLNYLRNL